MKWAFVNLAGAVAWVVGLYIAKGANLPDTTVFATAGNQVTIGVACGLAGMAVLLWTNLRSVP